MPMVPQHPKLKRVQASQAPIFQSKPYLAAAYENAAPLPLVTPLTVFAAGCKKFRAVVRAQVPKREALAMIFAALPLCENGWLIDETEIERVGVVGAMPRKDPIFEVWRT